MKVVSSEITRRKSISETTKIKVWAKAAGRCVLCAAYLIDERTYFHSAALVGQIAHNAGATDAAGSPRGRSTTLDRDDRAAESNLLLLCHPCHSQIDRPETRDLYTYEWVLARKTEHELRVLKATDFGALRRTLVVTTRGPVRGTQTHVSNQEVSEALVEANLFVHVEDGWRGDVEIRFDGDLDTTYAWDHAKRQIDDGLTKLNDTAQRSASPPDHVAVFALAPIPILAYLGSRLDDKLAIQVFDHHRDRTDGAWCWGQPGHEPVIFKVHTDDVCDPSVTDVVAALSVSGTVRDKNIPAALQAYPAISLTPRDATPQPGLIDSEACLNAAAGAWTGLLSEVEARWPNVQRIHLLAAIPASLAIRAGGHRMKDAQPDLVTYQLTPDGYLAAISISND